MIGKRAMTEDEVVREIQRLVAAGEYLDSMLGVAGVRLDDLAPLSATRESTCAGHLSIWRRVLQA